MVNIVGSKSWLRNTVWSQNRNDWLGLPCPRRSLGFRSTWPLAASRWRSSWRPTLETITVEDERTGRPKRLRTNHTTWSGRGFCKTQYASDARCGGVPNFLRAHLSVCRMLDYAKELGILASVSDEGDFFENRSIPALVNNIADWNAFIAAGVGALDKLVGGGLEAPIRHFPDFEQLEAAGQDQIDGFLRLLKERG